MLACELCVCTPSTYTSIFCDTRLDSRYVHRFFKHTRRERANRQSTLSIRCVCSKSKRTVCHSNYRNTVRGQELYAALRSTSTKRATGDCLERGMNFETSRGVVGCAHVGCPVERRRRVKKGSEELPQG